MAVIPPLPTTGGFVVPLLRGFDLLHKAFWSSPMPLGLPILLLHAQSGRLDALRFGCLANR
jgi:hypothetical protein